MRVVELISLSWLERNDVSIWPFVFVSELHTGELGADGGWCGVADSEWLKLSWFRVELRLSSRSFSASAVQGASEAKLLNCWWFCNVLFWWVSASYSYFTLTNAQFGIFTHLHKAQRREAEAQKLNQNHERLIKFHLQVIWRPSPVSSPAHFLLLHHLSLSGTQSQHSRGYKSWRHATKRTWCMGKKALIKWDVGPCLDLRTVTPL